MLELLLFLLIALPLAWFVSEFWNHRLLRILLGVAAIVSTAFIACALDHMLTTFNYNLSYGDATKDLIQTSIDQIESGNHECVLKAWREMNSKYHPTYENRAGYRELADAATARMKESVSMEPQKKQDK